MNPDSTIICLLMLFLGIYGGCMITLFIFFYRHDRKVERFLKEKLSKKDYKEQKSMIDYMLIGVFLHEKLSTEDFKEYFILKNVFLK